MDLNPRLTKTRCTILTVAVPLNFLSPGPIYQLSCGGFLLPRFCPSFRRPLLLLLLHYDCTATSFATPCASRRRVFPAWLLIGGG